MAIVIFAALILIPVVFIISKTEMLLVLMALSLCIGFSVSTIAVGNSTIDQEMKFTARH